LRARRKLKGTYDAGFQERKKSKDFINGQMARWGGDHCCKRKESQGIPGLTKNFEKGGARTAISVCVEGGKGKRARKRGCSMTGVSRIPAVDC